MTHDTMTGAELSKAQDALDWTNKRFTDVFGVTEATLCNWKADRTKIPVAVSIALRAMQAHPDDAANWISNK